MCNECLEAGVEGKLRGAVRNKNLVLPGDKVMLAFSGGASSWVLLHMLRIMRSVNTERPERGKVWTNKQATPLEAATLAL